MKQKVSVVVWSMAMFVFVFCLYSAFLFLEGTEAGTAARKCTTPFMTKYERARVLGTRALQIR